MNIGEKIKRIRQHRRMTQKELGELVDLSANRIAQYEMGYRVPKKPLLNQIAEALRVSPLALSDGGNGPANDILEQLFWLDEEQPGVIKLVPTERGTARYNANPNFALCYDDNDNWPPRSPVSQPDSIQRSREQEEQRTRINEELMCLTLAHKLFFLIGTYYSANPQKIV